MVSRLGLISEREVNTMTRRGPLRKVVETKRVPINPGGMIVAYQMREVLECGHEQRVLQDAFGHFYSYRRRCVQCEKKTPPAEKESPNV